MRQLPLHIYEPADRYPKSFSAPRGEAQAFSTMRLASAVVGGSDSGRLRRGRWVSFAGLLLIQSQHSAAARMPLMIEWNCWSVDTDRAFALVWRAVQVRRIVIVGALVDGPVSGPRPRRSHDLTAGRAHWPCPRSDGVNYPPWSKRCPRCDSNAHWTGFESVASADWATGARPMTLRDAPSGGPQGCSPTGPPASGAHPAGANLLDHPRRTKGRSNGQWDPPGQAGAGGRLGPDHAAAAAHRRSAF
jgi:hypothetical protein